MKEKNTTYEKPLVKIIDVGEDCIVTSACTTAGFIYSDNCTSGNHYDKGHCTSNGHKHAIGDL